MYDEMVKSLRICGDSVDAIDECCYEDCIFHERPINPLCMQVLCNKAADAIEELSKPRWVSVTEQVPEDFQKVLVFWMEHSEPMIDTAFWQKDAKRFDCEHWVRMEDKITHWMPLPEPPEEEIG